MADQLTILKQELANDPLGRGYAGMTDAQVVASLNTRNRTTLRVAEAGEVLDAIAPAEAATFTNMELQWLGILLGMSSVDFKRANVRTILQNLFPQATRPNSRAALIALAQTNISRTEEIGLSEVREGDVARARS